MDDPTAITVKKHYSHRTLFLFSRTLFFEEDVDTVKKTPDSIPFNRVVDWSGIYANVVIILTGGLGYQIYTIVLISILIAMFFSDLKYQILPDEEQLALFIVGLAYLIATNVPIPQIAERFVLSFVAMMPLLLLFLATKGRGMGFGDVKLLFIFGFLFELQGAFIILYVAFITGGFFGLVAILLRKTKMKSKIAFGPFLILGAILYLFYTKYFITEFNTILGI